ncbi:MAG: cupredoxin domain-containing protein [Deltaproteobacteria bacterium]|nr:cupredoxin domain-containing protein [Deltaproteobacteria bacterium]
MRYRVMLASLALAVTAGCSGTSTTTPNPATGTTTGTTGTTAATGASTGTSGTTGSTTVNVNVTSFKFTPQTMTVQEGQTVIWTNTDTIDHTVTSGVNGVPDGKFDQLLHPGETFSFTFDTAGTFPYFCRFHFTMGMVGSVTVSTAINTTGGTGTTAVPTSGASATSATMGTTTTGTTGAGATTTTGTTGAGATTTTGY